MAGTCKRCGGETTNTRAASPSGLCFGCETNPCRGVMDGCKLTRVECNKRYLHPEVERAHSPVPTDFVDLMADWMIEHGPDGHCDGHEIIAQLAWKYFLNRR